MGMEMEHKPFFCPASKKLQEMRVKQTIFFEPPCFTILINNDSTDPTSAPELRGCKYGSFKLLLGRASITTPTTEGEKVLLL